MPIYEVRHDSLAPVSATSFETERLSERDDIQRLLMDRIAYLGEWGAWKRGTSDARSRGTSASHSRCERSRKLKLTSGRWSRKPKACLKTY